VQLLENRNGDERQRKHAHRHDEEKKIMHKSLGLERKNKNALPR